MFIIIICSRVDPDSRVFQIDQSIHQKLYGAYKHYAIFPLLLI